MNRVTSTVYFIILYLQYLHIIYNFIFHICNYCDHFLKLEKHLTFSKILELSFCIPFFTHVLFNNLKNIPDIHLDVIYLFVKICCNVA